MKLFRQVTPILTALSLVVLIGLSLYPPVPVRLGDGRPTERVAVPPAPGTTPSLPKLSPLLSSTPATPAIQEEPPAPVGAPSAPRYLAHETAFARFADWAEHYAAANPDQRRAIEAEGIRLAEKRREAMTDLILADPRRALELAVPPATRHDLPAGVASLIEKAVSGRGTLTVRAALPSEGNEGSIPPVSRTVELGGEIYQAFVFGRRSDLPTRIDLALNGVALDGLMAVDENPVRILEPAEVKLRLQEPFGPAVRRIAEDHAEGEASEIIAETGGELVSLCCRGHLAMFTEELIAAEETANLAESARTEGTKRLLVLRVDFSDLEGEPFSENAGNEMIRGLEVFYREMSYGKAGFAAPGDGSDVTPTLRMPRTAAYYGVDRPDELRRDARAAAQAAGYAPANYDYDLTCMGFVPGFKWAGLGVIGAAGAWMRGEASVGVSAHELGHNFGLNHANFWDTAGQSVIGPGTSVEYGDKFDNMGPANAGSKHFNARYKALLNWLTTADVLNVTQSGTYRINAHDDPAAAGIRALRVAKNSNTNYWLEYRARYNGNKWLANGVGLRWAGSGNLSTRLLDLTPGSAAGKDDSCLLIGRTFSDPVSGVHITPVARGGTAVEYLDVVINLRPPPGNAPPTITLTAPGTTATPNTDVQFRVTAADPDGDTLAYYWDFGDGSYGGNTPATIRRWNATGEYLVQCTATDMKGGVATASVVMRIGSPSTFRIAGRILADGRPLQGVRVAASSTQLTHSDSDGRYALVGLVPGTYTLKATLEGYLFVNPSFGNSVTVGPSRDNVDFVAVPPGGQNTISLVAAGSVWQYRDDGSNQGTAWRDVAFDDSLWSEGPAPLGYGDDSERTVVRSGPSAQNKHVTTYFRRAFVIDHTTRYTSLTLGLRRDDGAIAYLNGREVFRSNMPVGTVGYQTLASAAVGGSDETTFFENQIDPAALRAGTNVLAVEVHQASRSSSDVVFDLELLGTELPFPSAGPFLSWEFTGVNFKIAWPDSPVSYSLQAADSLGPDAVWTAAPTPILSAEGRRYVIISLERVSRYYRLASPGRSGSE